MKICRGCNQEINVEIERYVHVEDWNCMKIESDSWWHLKCFGKAMNKNLTALEKQAANMLKKAGDIYQNLPSELTQSKKEFIIK